MSIFPTLDNFLELEEQGEEIKDGNLEPLFDFEKQRVVIKDGKIVMASWKEQIQQWIILLVKTEVGKFAVYKDTDFGLTDLYSLQGHQFLFTSFGISEVKRELREKIELNPRIEEVRSIDVENNFNTLKIEITVAVKAEDVTEEEVPKNEFEYLDINFNLGIEGEVIYFEWAV